MSVGAANEYRLIDVGEARAFVQKDGRVVENETLLLSVLDGVTGYCEAFLGRSLISREHVHSFAAGSSLELPGESSFYLPEYPVNEITLFRPYGYDEDLVNDLPENGGQYRLDRASGLITFWDGWSPSGPFEITYTAGYERDLTDPAEIRLRGWPEAARDLHMSILEAVRSIWKSVTQSRDDIQSVSADGATTTYISERIPKRVLATWRAHREWRA